MESYVKPGIFMVSLNTEERLAGSTCNGSCTSTYDSGMDLDGNGILHDPGDYFVYLVLAS